MSTDIRTVTDLQEHICNGGWIQIGGKPVNPDHIVAIDHDADGVPIFETSDGKQRKHDPFEPGDVGDVYEESIQTGKREGSEKIAIPYSDLFVQEALLNSDFEVQADANDWNVGVIEQGAEMDEEGRVLLIAGGVLYRVDAAGGVEELVNAAVDVWSIALHEAEGVLWYATNDAGSVDVYKADPDGSNAQLVVTLASVFTRGQRMEVDEERGELYAYYNSEIKIYSLDDGSVLDTVAGLNDAIAFETSPEDDSMLWVSGYEGVADSAGPRRFDKEARTLEDGPGLYERYWRLIRGGRPGQFIGIEEVGGVETLALYDAQAGEVELLDYDAQDYAGTTQFAADSDFLTRGSVV